MKTEQMLALLCLPYVMPDFPLHKVPDLMAVNYTVPDKRVDTRKFSPGVTPAEIAGAHKSRRIVPVRMMSAQVRPYQEHGRHKGAKRASITRLPEISEIAEQIQNDVYRVPENQAENPENYDSTSLLAGLPGMTPARRKVHDVALALSDDYLDSDEKLDMAEIRLNHPVSPLYTNSYSPVKRHIPWEAQEGF